MELLGNSQSDQEKILEFKSFNQSIVHDTIVILKKNSEDFKKVMNKFGGLCQPLCDLIAIIGHDNEFIERLGKLKSVYHDTINDPVEHRLDKDLDSLDIINKVAIKCHVLTLITIIELILTIIFKIYPASPLNYNDQKALLNERDGKKFINQDILQKTFDNMKNNQYMQLSFVRTKRIVIVDVFESGHATLIFKTNENGKIYYNFFDPFSGFYKSDKINILCDKINKNIDEYKFDSIGVIDLPKMLERSKVGKELMRKYNSQNRVNER